MSTRYKLLACSLTVGLGGLAVFATPPAEKKEPPAPVLPTLTVKPVSPANGADTPAPPKSKQGLEFELEIPTLPPAPMKSDDKKKPDPIPVLEDITPPAPFLVPAKAETPKPADKPKLPEVILPDFIPPVPVEVKLPPAPAKKPEPLKVAPPVAFDPIPAPPVRVEIPAPPITREPIPVPTPNTRPAPVKIDPKPVAETKLKMTLRMGDGQPRFEIRNAGTTELLLKVYGEKIELQSADAKSSLAGVSAIGKVRFTAPGIEGYCDYLTILSTTGEVLLKGNIRLKSKGGKAWSELTAEKMVYQIGTAGLVSAVRPVGHTSE